MKLIIADADNNKQEIDVTDKFVFIQANGQQFNISEEMQDLDSKGIFVTIDGQMIIRPIVTNCVQIITQRYLVAGRKDDLEKEAGK